MPELPPELQARYDELMQPIDLDAELRRIDAKLIEQHKLLQQLDPAAFRADLDRHMTDAWRQAEEDARRDRRMMAVLLVGGVVGAAAMFAAGMFVASRMPAGSPDDDVLALAAVSLFLVFLAVLLPRR